MADKPIRRKKNVEEGGEGVHRRDEALGGGPVGSQNGHSGNNGGTTGGGGQKRNRGFSPLSVIVVIVILLLGGGGSLLGGLSDNDNTAYTDNQNQVNSETSASNNLEEDEVTSSLDALFGSGTGYFDHVPSDWIDTPNTGEFNPEAAEGSREKRTKIIGNDEDITTIMVYMCGTDLESRSAMATRDLQEMMASNISDNINILVYTGGCKKWQNNVISNERSQIYQVKQGGLVLVKDDLEKTRMTDGATLTDFITWTADNYEANRYDLIFWDHGGGTSGGYGYDELYEREGSMGLSEIGSALKNSGVTFDFIGFDACLMATVETALVVSNYADYMIASEEVEPGIGWYYTEWLNAYSKNPSMETPELAKIIIDTYTDKCAANCRGQKTTLSLTDLAELQTKLPEEMKEFSNATSDRISNKDYLSVASARANTREFAPSSKIDQVDFLHLAKNMNTIEGDELAEVIRGCVKYNRTSSNMTNAYGLSIFFPYKKVSNVDNIVNTYESIGMDAGYTDCIQKFASMEVGGQIAAGGTMSPIGSIFGDSSDMGQMVSSADVLIQLFSTMMKSGVTGISGLDSSNSSFFGKNIDAETMAEYICENQLSSEKLEWTVNDAGDDVIKLSEDDWKIIEDVDVNIFYDDGEGYVDLGLDNSYDIDEDDYLIAPKDRTWVSINKTPVAYYRLDSQGDEDNYTITGKVPCKINGVDANLILVFNSENEDGFVAGASYDYIDNETETVAKNLTELNKGDKIDFVCDFYDYDKNFKSRYKLGNTLIMDGEMSDLHISNTEVGEGKELILFKLTDIYGQEYWTPAKEY
ncbi:clostripain-related cysteine peptidase [Butyrivibrio sp. AE3004]|uniref:clostripain-related cysteine peptidase n=1 Tax=Butyrivibrio sp. AE3004 TaxID=1506994 RepID=UPI0004949B6C|nr:clostripain-related cysteine peptidase [Butyrivibrio sp. AE3004]